jgi:hypothetical protein
MSWWFETTAAMSTGSAPVDQRCSMLLRQWPAFETPTTTRQRWLSARNAHVMPNGAATLVAKSRSSSAIGGMPLPLSWNTVRMNERTEISSSKCCASVINALLRARNPAIAATTPVVSGQSVVRT